MREGWDAQILRSCCPCGLHDRTNFAPTPKQAFFGELEAEKIPNIKCCKSVSKKFQVFIKQKSILAIEWGNVDSRCLWLI